MCAGRDVQYRKLKQQESTRLARACVYVFVCVFIELYTGGVLWNGRDKTGSVPADNVVGRNRAGTNNYNHLWRVVSPDAQHLDIVMYIL